MKTTRIIIVVLIAAIIAVFALSFLPGLRHRALDAYKKYGGWTPEARRADPVGFLEYAEKKLEGDLAALEDSRRTLGAASSKLAAERGKTEGLLSTADTLAGKFRTAYRAAKAGGAWPVEVSGANYSEHQLVDQVKLILSQKANYQKIIGELDAAAKAVKAKGEQLVTQVNTTKATLAILPAKKEIARVNKLTADIGELLGQVDDLLGANEKALEASPVRTVEELTAAKPTKPATGIDAEVKAFLEGGE